MSDAITFSPQELKVLRAGLRSHLSKVKREQRNKEKRGLPEHPLGKFFREETSKLLKRLALTFPEGNDA